MMHELIFDGIEISTLLFLLSIFFEQKASGILAGARSRGSRPWSGRWGCR